MRSFLFIIIQLVVSSAIAQAGTSAALDSAIKRGTKLTIDQKYPDAVALFSKLQRRYPENPAGYFFHAAVLQTQMMDFEKYDRIEEFERLIEKTITFARKQIKLNPDDARSYFYLGGAYGYRAFYHGKQKRYFEALQHSRRSVEALKMALQADSTLYDAYFGIGTYLYYRSKLSRYLTWLPFVEDEREKGMQMIKTAIQKGKYARYSAMNTYGWICIEEKLYEEGFEVIRQALAEFPESRVFLWCAGKLSAKLARRQQAIEYYSRILDSLESQNLLSPYNEVSCRKQMLEIYLEMGDLEKAKRECRKLSNLKLERKACKPCSEKLEAAHELCSEYAARTSQNSNL